MKRKRNDPLYVKIGDWVRINNPQMFVRCGYPLSFEDVLQDIIKNHLNEIKDFIEKTVLSSKNYNPNRKEELRKSSIRKIANTLAYEKLRAEKFGGNKRTIHVKVDESMRDKIYQVKSTRCVMTGNYIPCSGWNYNGCDEYEHPYLGDQKCHRILTLGDAPYGKDGLRLEGEFYLRDYKENAIEDCHVTKVNLKEIE